MLLPEGQNNSSRRSYLKIGVGVLVIILMVSLSSCGGKQSLSEGEKLSGPPAELITRLTSGVLSSKDTVMVRFSEPVVDASRLGQPQTPAPFHFTPDLAGEARWEDPSTLVFHPDSPLPFRTAFTGVLELKSLHSKWSGHTDVPFRFSVAGREIDHVVSEFHPVEKRDPGFVCFMGEIVLTETADADEVKSSVSLRSEGYTVPLTWEVSGRSQRFTFRTGNLDRPDSRQKYVLRINGKKLGLSGDFQREVYLNPVGKFTLENTFQKDLGKDLTLELVFSDPVDPEQDLAGLIRMVDADPDGGGPVKITPQAAGKSVFLSGNLVYGHRYTLELSGVRSRWGTGLIQPESRKIWFSDQKPRVSFEGNGVFLTSSLDRKLYFKTINVQRVNLVIRKVFESNLGQFLQSQQLGSRKDRNEDFSDYQIKMVGIDLIKKKLEIGKIKNRWLTHQLDISSLLPPGEKGVFLVEISFSREDMMYSGPKPSNRNYYGREYYSNPHSHGYLYRNGSVVKAVIHSDIGLLYKKGSQGHLVWALDLRSAKLLKGVHVRIRSYQNQVLAEGFSDSAGEVLFSDLGEKPFFIEGEKDGQRSVVVLKEMKWNTSSFDTGGVEPSPGGVRAFVFTERGVFRPGDTIHMGIIARNSDNTFPDGHPVSLTLSNPRNQPVYRLNSRKGKDGFYCFDIATKVEDMTGNWRAKIQLGDLSLYHTVKIETVVPFRLKIDYSDLPERMAGKDRKLNFSLSARYLFGSPGKDLQAKVSTRVSSRRMRMPRFPHMVFSNSGMSFPSYEKTIFEKKLDENGLGKVSWELPDFSNAPGRLSIQLNAGVQEKGGRTSQRSVSLPLDPFDRYVGIGLKGTGGFTRVGAPMLFQVVLVNPEGNPVSGRTLRYRIFNNARYWWWEYDSRNEFRARFKKDSHTRKLKEGVIRSGTTPVDLGFTPDSRGEYFLEISDASPGGHRAGIFFSSYHWGDAPAELENAGVLEIRKQKKGYAPGDEAELFVKTPVSGMLRVAVEKGDKILKRFSVRTDHGGETAIRIPVTGDMLPNAYVSVAMIQPLDHAENDRPLRMYGVVPLNVYDPHTRQELVLEVPEELQSGKDFSITVKTRDEEPTQLIAAVVDEGLLSLTDFETPDPWKFFFAKERLGILTYDLYSHIIGARKGDLFRLFSTGGDMATATRESQLQPGEKKRFTPVALFTGPVETDSQGVKKLHFRMPGYIGAVRVMVLSAKGDRYGSISRSVPVRTPLMVMPTLPRVLGPDDEFTIPVTVFTMKKGLRKVKVNLEVSGPIEVVPPARRELVFSEPGEKDTYFSLRVKPATGEAQVSISAEGGRYRAEQKTVLNIRPYSPRTSRTHVQEAKPGDKVKLKIPGDGIPGTNEAVISISGRRRLNLEHRLGWLIHYPYGCIEQTVSAVFPQLMLKEFIKASGADVKEIDANINGAIQRIQKFQLPSGGFSFWPGARRLSVWGTSYAGHFLLEAKKLGYYVPEELLSAWRTFQETRSRTTTDNLMTRLYRAYGLTQAGTPPWAALNLMRENSLKEMTNPEKWMLAACYHLAGNPNVSNQILVKATTSVNPYSDPGETFGSWLRDKAVILEQAATMKRWKEADLLYDELVEALSGKEWYSTQSLGYALLAVGKYIHARGEKLTGELPLLQGNVLMPDGEKKTFSARSRKITFPVISGFGKDALVKISPETAEKRCFVAVEWSGVPLKPMDVDESRNLALEVRWLDESGVPLDPGSLPQGKAFWAHFRVRAQRENNKGIQNLALVQVLPSGWEIENLRLTGTARPNWMQGFNLNREDYMDLRDDRVIWFFSLDQKPVDFVVKLNAVIPGRFILPPSLVEGMYDNRFRAAKKGSIVRVSGD